MASERRPQHIASHSRKRVRLGLGDITNSPCQTLFRPKVKKPRFSCLYERYANQVVPGYEDENIDTSMYCSETLEFLPCSKKQCTSKDTSPIVLNPGGLFNSLPLEILHKVFGMLGLESLVSLCLGSSVVMSYVRGYVHTSAGLSHILPPIVTDSMDVVSISQFALLGKLIKAITTLNPIHTRLKVGAYFVDKLQPIRLSICHYLRPQLAYQCFGAAFNGFVSGLDNSAKTKAFEFVKSNAHLLERTNTVLQSYPGSLPWIEMDVRSLHRELFLSTAFTDQEYGFWLSLILKPWPLVFQAKLVYLLTAPGDASGRVYWTEPCGCSHLQHTSGEKLDFSELAQALRVLYQHHDWTEDDIVTIFNEITTSTPTGWCLENVALLLFGCGSSIVKGVLGSKAINGQVNELGMICYYMANCCVSGNVSEEAIDEDIAWFLHILSYVAHLLPAFENKDKFITDLISKWQTYLLALLEDYDPVSSTDAELVDFAQEFHSTISSLTRICQSLIQSKLHSLNWQ